MFHKYFSRVLLSSFYIPIFSNLIYRTDINKGLGCPGKMNAFVDAYSLMRIKYSVYQIFFMKYPVNGREHLKLCNCV